MGIVFEGIILFLLFFLAIYITYNCGYNEGLKKGIKEIKKIHDLIGGRDGT